jgi:hypothetical protein
MCRMYVVRFRKSENCWIAVINPVVYVHSVSMYYDAVNTVEALTLALKKFRHQKLISSVQDTSCNFFCMLAGRDIVEQK